jgi:hypothetical protein
VLVVIDTLSGSWPIRFVSNAALAEGVRADVVPGALRRDASAFEELQVMKKIDAELSAADGPDKVERAQ